MTPTNAATLVETAAARLGGLDIVVHNAGGPPPGDFFSVDEGQWQHAFEQNMLSFVRIVDAAVPHLKTERRRADSHDRVLVDQTADSKPRAVERAARRCVGSREDAVA